MKTKLLSVESFQKKNLKPQTAESTKKENKRRRQETFSRQLPNSFLSLCYCVAASHLHHFIKSYAKKNLGRQRKEKKGQERTSS